MAHGILRRFCQRGTRRPHEGLKRQGNSNKATTCLDRGWWWWWCGPVCMTTMFIHESQRMHLIMGAVSLWTRPPPCTCVQGPKKAPQRLVSSTAGDLHSNLKWQSHAPVVQTTGTSTTLAKNCMELHVFCTVTDHELCRCTNGHVSNLDRELPEKT